MAIGLKKGSLLDHGKYRIERILGQGGFGITYLATDLGLDKLRAIKEFFPKDYCDRDETTSRITLGTANTSEFVDKLKKKFIKEARNIANLDQHQGIITIHAVFEDNNTAYYVMDYIEGENLSSRVKKDGPLPVEKAIKYITEVGHALEYVHQHHINHLDVKPANIMVRRKDDMPILIDFGLSKQYDSEGLQTSTTPTGISHGYAPFEQYKDGGVKEFSPQTDVYSLAATLYYLVSGKVPPHATDLIENELSFPEGFPYFLKGSISKAMSLKRQGRHETIKEFISSLKPEDETTVLEVPNRSGGIPISDNSSNGSLPTSENARTGNHPLPDNSNGNISTSENQIDIDPVKKRNKNKGCKTGGRRKYNFPAYFKKHKNDIIGLCLGIIVITGGVLIGVFSNSQKSTSEQTVTKGNIQNTQNKTPIGPRQVRDKKFLNPFGEYSYTGPVDENGKPDGSGYALFTSGEYKGNTYTGWFYHGIMAGSGAHFKLRNGDEFQGHFDNNRFSSGTYTKKSTGEYFKGSFKNGQPFQGTWFDKNGYILEKK